MIELSASKSEYYTATLVCVSDCGNAHTKGHNYECVDGVLEFKGTTNSEECGYHKFRSLKDVNQSLTSQFKEV